MGYRIQYDSTGHSVKNFIDRKQSKKIWMRILSGILVVIVLIGLIYYKNTVIRYLLPGDYEITTAAFQDMITNLRSGTSVRESVTVFCEEILTNEPR